MDDPSWVIIKPGLERKVFFRDSGKSKLVNEGNSRNICVKDLKSGLILGYEGSKLGLISPSVLDFYKEKGFNWKTIKQSELGFQLSFLRPTVLNDSFKEFDLTNEEYTPSKGEILVLTYNSPTEVVDSLEESYLILPLFEEELIKINSPKRVVELVKEYHNHQIFPSDLSNLAESYKRLASLDSYLKGNSIDIGEIPFHTSIRN